MYCYFLYCKERYLSVGVSFNHYRTNNLNFSRQDMYFRGAAAVVLKSDVKAHLLFDLFILLHAFYL